MGEQKLKIENPENPTETDVMKAIIGGDMETLSNLKDKPILNKTLNLLTEEQREFINIQINKSAEVPTLSGVDLKIDNFHTLISRKNHMRKLKNIWKKMKEIWKKILNYVGTLWRIAYILLHRLVILICLT